MSFHAFGYCFFIHLVKHVGLAIGWSEYMIESETLGLLGHLFVLRNVFQLEEVFIFEFDHGLTGTSGLFDPSHDFVVLVGMHHLLRLVHYYYYR